MAKLTKEQVRKWNAQLAGDFYFDWKHYLVWSEKVARRNVKLSDGKVLQATLEYRNVRDGFRYTGEQQPILHLAVWQPTNTEGMMSSHGMGVTIDVGVKQDKKKWSELCKLSALYDSDEKLLELAREHMDELKNEYIA